MKSVKEIYEGLSDKPTATELAKLLGEICAERDILAREKRVTELAVLILIRRQNPSLTPEEMTHQFNAVKDEALALIAEDERNKEAKGEG